jgi:membrane protein
MTLKIEDLLLKIPLVKWFIVLLKKNKIPGLEGMSFYHFFDMYISGILKGALTSRAGAIAFNFFMAIFPFLLFTLNLLPFLPIDSNDFRAVINSLAPTETASFLQGIVDDILNNQRDGLLISNLILAMFLMANGVTAVFVGFEYSYHIKQTRNPFSMYLYSFGVGLLLAFLLLFTISIIGLVEIYVLKPFDELFGQTAEIIVKKEAVEEVRITQLLIFTMMAYISTSILYFFGTKEGRQARFFSKGALLTTLLLVLTTFLFGIYVKDFSKHNELYGSIGTLLVLMLYIWVNSVILLLGFELNASLNKIKKIQALEQLKNLSNRSRELTGDY